MYNLLSLEFILYFLYSLGAIFLSVFIPGNVILRFAKIKLPALSEFVVSMTIGTSVLVLIGFIFGYLNLRFISILYILFCVIVWFYRKFWNDFSLKFSKNFLFSTLLILCGVTLQLIPAFLFNIVRSDGLSFCCIMVSDNLYFAALSQELVYRVPPFESGLYGVAVHNYHYMSNLFVAEISRIFQIPISIFQFQVSSVYLSVMLGLSVLAFGRAISKRWAFSWWLLFFTFFGGDFIWLVIFWLHGPAHMFTMSSLEDGVKFLSNPPRAYAIVQLFGGMTLLTYFFKNKSYPMLVLTAIIMGTLIGFKVYVGIFALLGIVAIGILNLFRKDYKYLLLAIASVLISAILYFPVNRGAGGLYFTSFWFFENFIVQPYLGLERLELARVIFRDDGKILKSLFFELIFIALTVFSLFGTKLIALMQFPASARLLPKNLHIFLIAGIVPSLVAGFFFQQTSGGSNTFNFLVNALTAFSIYVASVMTIVSSLKKVGIAITILVIGMTIPRVAYETYASIKRISTDEIYYFTNNEVEAMRFLKNQPQGLTFVDHKHFAMDEVSPYIRFYTSQPMFASGIGILESHGVKLDQKKKIALVIEEGEDATLSARMLANNKISYILTGTRNPQLLYTGNMYADVIFKNSEITIFAPSKEKADILMEKNKYEK